MRVATKSVSRDGDIKGKYLYARPHGAAYMKGPPPDYKKKKLPYLDARMMRMAPYPGLKDRYDAYANQFKMPPKTDVYVPPAPALPEDVKDEPVDFQIPTTETAPEDVTITVQEPGDNVPRIGWTDTVTDTIDNSLALVRRGADIGNVVSTYATSMVPYVGYLVNVGQLSTEGGLRLLFGSSADPLIDFVRQNDETRRWVTRVLSDNAIQPAAGIARAGSAAIMRSFLNNPQQFTLQTFGTALSNTGQNLITAGANEILPVATRTLGDVASRTIPDSGQNIGGSIIHTLLNVLAWQGSQAGIQPPENIEQLADTISGPVTFAGGYSLRPRDASTGQVVRRAVLNNVLRPAQQYLARRGGFTGGRGTQRGGR